MAIKITEWKDLFKISPALNGFVSFTVGFFGFSKLLKTVADFDASTYVQQYGWWFLPGLVGVVLVDRFRSPPDTRRDAADCLDKCVYVVTSKERLYDELWRGDNSVVKTAKRSLVVMGSRSRDKGYLDAIQAQLALYPSLEHARILVGSPHHAVLEEHIQELLKVAAKRDYSNGDGKVTVCRYELGGVVPERFVAASETKAVITLPTLNIGNSYDTALVIDDDAASQKLCSILATMARECQTVYDPAGRQVDAGPA
ncbi:hypothetical protein [Celeribacter sp.]|uniref:hypothetical protein n=1 Tax=Celeribacter sp. TaxID=1890673 RepID=UPI003A928414